jgi:hypothetical protein
LTKKGGTSVVKKDVSFYQRVTHFFWAIIQLLIPPPISFLFMYLQWKVDERVFSVQTTTQSRIPNPNTHPSAVSSGPVPVLPNSVSSSQQSIPPTQPRIEIKTYPNGNVYEGNLTDGEPNGKGIMTYKDGRIYDGFFENGLMHGLGSMTWTDGDKYIGCFKDGFMHGKGTNIYADGITYSGVFSFNEWHGEGIITHPDGTLYKGELKKSLQHGVGIMLQHGVGIMIDKNRTIYDGFFENGRKHGQGSLTWTDGRKYIGCFKDGFMHGPYVFTDKDGTIYEGTATLDKLTSSRRQVITITP